MSYPGPDDFQPLGGFQDIQESAKDKTIEEMELETRQIQAARDAKRERERIKREAETSRQDPPARPTKKQPTSTLVDFNGGLQHLQVRLPSDLCQSLKLASIQEGRSISDIVLECLTSQNMVAKKWVHTKGGKDAA